MSRANIATEATLLVLRKSGENGQLLTFLSPTHGLLQAFKRTASSRSAKQPAPDLFDEVSLTLEPAREGEMLFVREYLVRHRRTKIGESYQALLFASRFALLLSRHLFTTEEAPEWHALLQQTLTAWETNLRPDAAYFKSLYLFAKKQGIPVKEEWFPELRPDQLTKIAAILREPLAAQTTPAPIVETLTSAFETYLHHQHEIRF